MENSFCTEPGVLNVFLILKTTLSLIQIIVPIILIIMSMLDLAKAVASSEEEMKKTFPKLIKRIISASLVFLVPAILGSFLGIVDNNADYRSASCWTNANRETIETLEIAKIAERRAQAEEMAMETYITIEELYGPNTITQSSTLPEKMIAIAIAEEGKRGVTYQQAYGLGKNSAWCVMFVWWVSNEAGVHPTYMSVKEATTTNMYKYFNSGKDANAKWNKSISRGGNYTPKMGDYIFFKWSSSSSYITEHIGIVIKVEGDTLTYIHGNTSNNPATSIVKISQIKIRSSNIVGYGSWY